MQLGIERVVGGQLGGGFGGADAVATAGHHQLQAEQLFEGQSLAGGFNFRLIVGLVQLAEGVLQAEEIPTLPGGVRQGVDHRRDHFVDEAANAVVQEPRWDAFGGGIDRTQRSRRVCGRGFVMHRPTWVGQDHGATLHRGLAFDPNPKAGHDFVLQPDTTKPPQLCGSRFIGQDRFEAGPSGADRSGPFDLAVEDQDGFGVGRGGGFGFFNRGQVHLPFPAHGSVPHQVFHRAQAKGGQTFGADRADPGQAGQGSIWGRCRK